MQLEVELRFTPSKQRVNYKIKNIRKGSPLPRSLKAVATEVRVLIKEGVILDATLAIGGGEPNTMTITFNPNKMEGRVPKFINMVQERLG
jgi:hypothetical protein